jgi:hypothetical protein
VPRHAAGCQFPDMATSGCRVSGTTTPPLRTRGRGPNWESPSAQRRPFRIRAFSRAWVIVKGSSRLGLRIIAGGRSRVDPQQRGGPGLVQLVLVGEGVLP